MAGLDDYQFFSNLRERDTPFWQKTFEEKNRPMEPSDYYRRPTEFPENLLNPPQGSPQMKVNVPKPSVQDPQKGNGQS